MHKSVYKSYINKGDTIASETHVMIPHLLELVLVQSSVTKDIQTGLTFDINLTWLEHDKNHDKICFSTLGMWKPKVVAILSRIRNTPLFYQQNLSLYTQNTHSPASPHAHTHLPGRMQCMCYALHNLDSQRVIWSRKHNTRVTRGAMTLVIILIKGQCLKAGNHYSVSSFQR